jgi:hypothetical protein
LEKIADMNEADNRRTVESSRLWVYGARCTS